MPARLAAFSGLGFDYVLAGHFHRGYDVRRYDGGYFVYPGSPVSVTRKETGLRHVNLVETGTTPQAVAVDTRHVIDMDIRLEPFASSNPLETIRRRVRDVHPKAAVYLTVSGFPNLDAMGMTEREFEEAVRRFETEDHVEEVTTRWQDVSAILDNELFKRFRTRLHDSEPPPRNLEKLQDMVIDAFTETMHED
jgi:DNA repair exonuclease SbcCD nuclease subunit